MPDSTVEIQGRHLKLTNLDKVLYPVHRIHQGAGHRLLRAHRAGFDPALFRTSANAEALPQRRRSAVFLREECYTASSRLGQDGTPSGAKAISATSITFLLNDLPHWSGSRIWLRSNSILRWPWPKKSLAPPWWSSISIPARRRTSSSVARSGCGCAISSSISACKAFPKLPARRDCRFTFR